MRRIAAILEKNPTTGKEEYRFYHNPTIGDIYNLRNRGAIIMKEVITRYGNEVHRDWVTDSGRVVTCRIDFLPRCKCCHE